MNLNSAFNWFYILLCLNLGLLFTQPNSASAIGLSEIKVHSDYLEPLDAHIILLNSKVYDRKQLNASLDKTQLKSANSFLELEALNFEIIKDNGKENIIRVTTSQPLTVPFLDFSIVVKYPHGSISRNYIILPDFSLDSDKSPHTTPTQTNSKAPDISPQNIRKQTAKKPSHINSRPLFDSQYSVQVNDTLSGIAQRIQPRQLNLYDAIALLRTHNPQLSKNSLLAGDLLHIPSKAQFAQTTLPKSKLVKKKAIISVSPPPVTPITLAAPIDNISSRPKPTEPLQQTLIKMRALGFSRLPRSDKNQRPSRMMTGLAYDQARASLLNKEPKLASFPPAPMQSLQSNVTESTAKSSTYVSNSHQNVIREAKIKTAHISTLNLPQVNQATLPNENSRTSVLIYILAALVAAVLFFSLLAFRLTRSSLQDTKTAPYLHNTKQQKSTVVPKPKTPQENPKQKTNDDLYKKPVTREETPVHEEQNTTIAQNDSFSSPLPPIETLSLEDEEPSSWAVDLQKQRSLINLSPSTATFIGHTEQAKQAVLNTKVATPADTSTQEDIDPFKYEANRNPINNKKDVGKLDTPLPLNQTKSIENKALLTPLNSEFQSPRLTEALAQLTLALNEKAHDDSAQFFYYIAFDKFDQYEKELGLMKAEYLAEQAGLILQSKLERTSMFKRLRFNTYAVLTDAKTNTAALEFAQQLALDFFETPISVNKESFFLTLSIGVIPLSHIFKGADEVINAGETLISQLREHDGNVGNGAKIHQPNLSSSQLNSTKMIISIGRDLIERNAFSMLYEPLMPLHLGIKASTEMYQAHTIINPSITGDNLPNHLVGKLYTSDISAEIGRFCLLQAMTALAKIKESKPLTRLFLPVSASMTEDPSFTTWLEANILRLNLPTANIVFKLHGNDVARKFNQMQHFAQFAHTSGASICIAQVEAHTMPQGTLETLAPEFIAVHREAVHLLGSETDIKAQRLAQSQKLRKTLEMLVNKNIQIIVPEVSDVHTITELWSMKVNYVCGGYVKPPSPLMDYDFEQ